MPALAEPPARVGRLSYLQGEVSFFMDRDDGWQRAAINFPVTSENSLWTENGGRAEVRIGSSALRIDDRSILDFVRVDDNLTQTFLQRGTVNLRIRTEDNPDRRNDGETFRVETSAGQFVFSVSGRYRVEALPDGVQTRVTVFDGRAHFDGRDGRIGVEAGKSLLVRASGDSIAFQFEPATESSFDRWADARDQDWNKIHSRYVIERSISPYMTGYEDLDPYGDWIDDREYGRLWTPRVVVSDWAPYRYGHWAQVQPWGWTWIDDAAWGFAPFHYGRWVYVSHRSRWAWWPGPYVRRPVYAPALVAWFNRPGVNISIASGPAVGWVPLGPREHYLPRYSNNPNYIRNLNHFAGRGSVIAPPVRYANHLHGATVVNNHVFHRGQPVGRNFANVPPAVIAAQVPGSGANFGQRFNRQDGNGPRERRNDERRPTFASPGVPPSPLPPVLAAQPAQSSAIGAAPRNNRPAPVPVTGGASPFANGQPTVAPRGSNAPVQNVPSPSASMESRPIVAAPVQLNRSAPIVGVDQNVRQNTQRPRRERPAVEPAPAQPMPPVAINPGNNRVVERIAPPPRPPQNAEQRPVPRPPPLRAEQAAHPVPAPVGRANPVPPPVEPKAEGRNKPLVVER